MTINKKFLQFLGAILIIIFHLWIKLSNTFLESFFVGIAYIGVDLFFLISVCSLANKDIDYKSFIINRFKTIYVKFIVFIIIMALFTQKYSNIFNRLFFIELFTKGGGAFLWFIPAILIFYLLFPFFIKWKNKYKSLIILIAYIILASICTFTKQNQLMIVLNRIPLILLTYELCIREIKNQKLLGCIFLVIGLVLLYFFGYSPKLNIPFYNFFYVFASLAVIGIALLVPKFKCPKIIELIASSSLEIYAFQMIFGFKLAVIIFQYLNNALLANIITISLVILVSIIFNYLFKYLTNKIATAS